MQKKLFRIVAHFLFLCGFVYSASLACSFATDSGGGGSSSGSGILYLLDNATTEVYIFGNAVNLNGTLTISQQITGDPNETNTNPSNIFMENPTALAVDGQRDILYVADGNQNGILAFTGAHALNGQASATRFYPYAGTNDNVVDMFYDGTNDVLYVADANQLTIFKWERISVNPLATNTPPTSQIYLGFAMSSMTVDVTHNLLYVGNPTASPSPAVQMYNGLLTLSTSGSNPPTATNIFTDSTQTFVNLDGMAVNPTVVSGGILYVSETGYPSVEIFNNASNLENAVAATAELMGSNTGLVKNQLSKIIIQPANSNTLWAIAGNTLINVWTDAQQINPVNGNQAPSSSLSISGASQIVSLGLDMTR